MKCEIRKEIQYALRCSRAVILFVSFLFIALLTPVMLKLVLPQVLGSQLAGGSSKELREMMNMTQLGCMRSYMSDVFEIGTIVVAFTLCGLTASEIRGNTWVLPLCAGKRYAGMVCAKLLVFGILLIVVLVIALLADYGYSGVLFGFEVGIFPVVFCGLLQGIYMLFLLTCIIMWGVLMQKPIPTGFLTLATAYGIHFASSLFQIHRWTPSGLLLEAQTLNLELSPSLLSSLTATVLLTVFMFIVTLTKLKHIELNIRST